MHPHVPSSIPSPTETTLTFQRSRDRLGIVCPIMFAGAPFIAEGVIHNVSHTGCTVESDRIVLNGSYLIVRLLLPDADRALNIELAAIRWVRQGHFGLEFIRIPPVDRVRLDQFLFDRHR